MPDWHKFAWEDVKMEQSSRANAPARSGLSLLEILIAVFVLSIGLLGVAAVIPLGYHQIVEAIKSDRAGACGRAGLHEVRTRGWLNPLLWRQMAINEMDPIGTPAVPLPPPNTLLVTDGDGDGDNDGVIRMRDSFAIDPLFFVHQDFGNATNPMVWRFPLDASSTVYNGTPWQWRSRQSSLIRVTVIPRVNFNWLDLSTAPNVARMPFAAASRIFTWRDDMLFPVPDDPDDRPRQLVTWDGGRGFAYPLRGTDSPLVVPAPTSPVMPLADDNYSWMATVTPIIDGQGDDVEGFGVDSTDATENLWYSNVNTITRYVVSIVVFYKRNFECPDYPFDALNFFDPVYPPQERSLQVFFPGDGYGGGDVLLVTDRGLPWLEVRKNGWLMLRGLELVGPVDPALLAAADVRRQPYWRTVAKWYRVIAVDGEILVGGAAGVPAQVPVGSFGRYVTLSGPDWRVDTSGDGTFDPLADWAIATLVDDVIGVYTTTVEADYGSVWTQ
jgi:hypothetical protein